jgi:sugar lactone lactonase YvrE
MLLPIAILALASQIGGTATAAPAGTFPDFIPLLNATRGVAVDKVGNVFVSVGEVQAGVEHIMIYQFTPYGVGPSFVADIGRGTIGGLMVTANGDLYAALAAGADRGVYQVGRKGQKELLPGSNQIFFANGLAFDERGTLYVTESVSPTAIVNGKVSGPGGIWRIPRGEGPELWLRDEVLTGTGALPPSTPVWIGANGIAYYHGNLFVTNTEKGTVMRIPVLRDGSAGVPDVWALQEVPESLPPLRAMFPVVMGDGIALDVHGNLYVAVLTRSAVVRINARDLSQDTVAAFQIAPYSVPFAPLDFPASLFFGTGKSERTSLFVTNLGMGGWAGPGLVKIDAGVPGDPLH